MSEKFEYYRNKSLEQLKLINPKWAYGENRNKILDIALKGRNANSGKSEHPIPVKESN